MATRWRFGGGSVAPRGRFVTGRRRLVADRHRSRWRPATGRRALRCGSPPSVTTDRQDAMAIRLRITMHSVYESPCNGDPSTNHHAMAIRLRITSRTAIGAVAIRKRIAIRIDESRRASTFQIGTSKRVAISPSTRAHSQPSPGTLKNGARASTCPCRCSKNGGKPLRWSRASPSALS